MNIRWPVLVLLFGGLYTLYFSRRIRKFKLSDQAPASRAHLSVEERQRKMRVASNIAVATGVVMIAGAALLVWMEHSG
jgi:hypothetical protein